MDDLIYSAMSGAKALMQRQEAIANNIANISTTGFRADLAAFRAVPVEGDGASTRVYNIEVTTGFDAQSGPLRNTGRALDVAVQGDGWLAVQRPDGSEAYSRDGALTVGADGTLQTLTGLTVQGQGGPMVIPANADLSIASDGSVSARVGSAAAVQVGRLKLVNPALAELRKADDGLIETINGEPALADENVRVVEGALEGSNVNAAEAMIGMIAVARQFELQLRLLTTAEQNELKATQLLGSN